MVLTSLTCLNIFDSRKHAAELGAFQQNQTLSSAAMIGQRHPDLKQTELPSSLPNRSALNSLRDGLGLSSTFAVAAYSQAHFCPERKQGTYTSTCTKPCGIWKIAFQRLCQVRRKVEYKSSRYLIYPTLGATFSLLFFRSLVHDRSSYSSCIPLHFHAFFLQPATF